MAKGSKPKIPLLANWLVMRFIDDTLLEEFFGDLQEIHQDRILGKDKVYAKLMYWVDALHLILGFSSLRVFGNQPNPTIMLNNYLKVAIRNLSRNKVFSLINILSLAIGMGVCLVIYQYIHFELSYDRFHSNAKNTYRVTQTAIKNGEELSTGVDVTHGLGPAAKEIVPEIENCVRINPDEIGLIVINQENNERYQEDNMWYVDDGFLQMFDFPLKYGDPDQALNEMHNIVITEQIAARYFGDTDPLGKPLKVSGGVLGGNFIVTGVLSSLPLNSHLQFDFLLPMEFLLEKYGPYKEGGGWHWENFVTYITVNGSADLRAVAQKFDRVIAEHIGENLARRNLSLKTGFQPVTDVHLRSGHLSWDYSGNNGDIQNVHFFAIIATFILIIAWVNYINLSTAHAMHRAKEVGIRKSIGAMKKQLIAQFIMESILINVLAAIMAIGIAYFALPLVNKIIGTEISSYVLQSQHFWLWFSAIIMSGSILSGLYPAFVLSSFKPVSVLKSVATNKKMGLNLRRGLLVFQFLISILLISGTYLVYKQITFMKDQHLGMDIEKILVVNGPRVVLESLKREGATLGSKYQAFKDQALNHHSISAVTATSNVPGKGYTWSGNIRKPGDPENVYDYGSGVLVDTDFATTYNMEFVAKTRFPEQIHAGRWIIINEETVKTFGLGTPLEALNEQLIVFNDTLKILAIAKNVHWSSLRDAYSPILYVLDNEYGVYFSLKINLSDIQRTIAHIKSAYHSVFPEDPFYYFFLDDEFNRQYQADLQFGNLFTVFSLLAVFISCLGLFALVSFSAVLRTKEMGIRKVFGANVEDLMLLLSKEYVLLLMIANVLAIQVVIVAGRYWLNNYAYKTGIGAELLLIPGLLLMIISFVTLSYRTFTTARANPTDSLRTE